MSNQNKTQLILNLIIITLCFLIIVLIGSLAFGRELKAPTFGFFERNQGEEPVDTADQSQVIEQLLDLAKIEPDKFVFAPILNFHHIGVAPARSDKITKSFYLAPAQLEQLIEELLANGYKFIFVSEIVNYIQNGFNVPDKHLALTFDDGNIDFYNTAWPILKKYQAKSSMYIMTGVSGEDYLSDQQILELAQSNLVEIGSHTVWHPKLTKISREEQLFELEHSKEELENLLQQKIITLCYPFGLYDDAIKEVARAIGYQAGLTFDQDAWQNPADLLALKRISVYPELNVMKLLEKLAKN